MMLTVRNTKYSGFAHVREEDLKLAFQLADRVSAEVDLWFTRNKPELLKRD
jgi:hypothetical protein